MTLDQFLDRLENVRRSNGGFMARCPAHEDRSPSLSVCEGDNGRVVVHCFAGCTVDKVCAALGLRLSDLFADDGRPERWVSWRPQTPEERAAERRRRLEQSLRTERRLRLRAERALQRAALLVGIAYSDDPERVLDRLLDGAAKELDREASERADREAA